VAGLLVGHRQAASAADLAALAGAAAVQRGEPACGAARHIVEENHASLVGCSERDQTVDVEVAVRMPGLFGALALRARARAGPVSAGASSDDGLPPVVTRVRV
jgi:secretion/DNA translocation related TadE-like protein